MQWRKPADKKYTDLCIYIDKNIPNIVNPGEYPEIENTVYNYIWLVIKALAIKKGMFNNFQDYDPYAFYSANRVYFAIRKNYWNQGKTIKGKLIRPIKSSLNYIKALMRPMQIEYQNETFREIISEEFTSKKFDAYAYKEHLRADAKERSGVTDRFRDTITESFERIGDMAAEVISKSAFGPSETDRKKLKISLLLNAINSLKTKGRLDSDAQVILLWKLPKSMASYVRILLKEFYTAIKNEIMECHAAVDLSDDVVDKIIDSTTGDDDGHDDQY